MPPTSGNRIPEYKHGPEVRGSRGSRYQKERGGFYTSSAPGGASPSCWDLKGPPCLQSVTLDSHSKPSVPGAFGCVRVSDDPTSRRRPREDVCPVSGARWWAHRGPDTGVRGAPSGEAPAEGRALGQGSSSPGPHAGRGTASPGGQRPRSAASRPPRGRRNRPSHQPSDGGRHSVHNGGWFHFGKGSPPHPRGFPPTPGPPRLTFSRVQVARGAHQQRGDDHHQQHGCRPPPAPGAHGCGSAGCRRIRARGAGWRGAYSEAAAPEALGVARPSLPRGQPKVPQPAPGRTLDTAPGGARGLRCYESGSAAGWRRSRLRAPAARAPVPTILGPGAPRCAPLTLGSWPRALRSSDLRTRGQTDVRTGGRAPGLAGGGQAAGARAARPVNNAARQLGPVRAAGKGGADLGSEGTRRPAEAREGWKEDGQGGGAAPPARRSPYPGPRAGGPRRAVAEGAL